MQNIFLAGAHTTGAPLPELVDEIRTIEGILRPLMERGLWNVLSNRAANLTDVFDTFSRKEADIAVFHYAGHAGQRELHLEGGGQVGGIAELFGLTQGAALRLVFLNGCATAGHVASLHAAGAGAVVATSRPVGDPAARALAERFYRTWTIEGKTLDQAFQTAAAQVHSLTGEENRPIVVENRSIGEIEDAQGENLPWGLYINPQLSEDAQQRLRQWTLNPPPQLPPQLLKAVRTRATESLLELVYAFEQQDADASAEIAEGKDPLLVLITRLPWTVGTHLRRLFALDDSQSMAEPGLERLRELASAYTELMRFISYTALSALWDERQSHNIAAGQLEALQFIPASEEEHLTDYLHRLRQYHALLEVIPGDPIGLEAKISDFLKQVDDNLTDGYRFMEELKQALADPDQSRLQDLVALRTGKSDGLADICLQAETLFARFLQATLFLTEYKLYTVRAISVDKVRYLDVQNPFVHKTMILHGAFSDVNLVSTQRQVASDNYCILLAPRKQEDALANALNLSPFYIDKNAFLSDKADNYPAIYVLKYRDEQEDFVFQYIDNDVNHRYIFEEDHRLLIRNIGAVFPPALKIPVADCRKFSVVHQQLLKFNRDFQVS